MKLIKIFFFVISFAVFSCYAHGNDYTVFVEQTCGGAKAHISKKGSDTAFCAVDDTGNWSSLLLDDDKSLKKAKKYFKNLELFSNGGLKLKNFEKSSYLSITTQGSVTFEDVILDRLKLSAHSVEFKGLNVINAAEKFRVDNFIQAKNSIVKLAQGEYHVAQRAEIGEGAQFRALRDMTFSTNALKNAGQIIAPQTDCLYIDLKQDVDLGVLIANNLIFRLADAVSVAGLMQQYRNFTYETVSIHQGGETYQNVKAPVAYNSAEFVTQEQVQEKGKTARNGGGRDKTEAIKWLVQLKTSLEKVKGDPRTRESEESLSRITDIESYLNHCGYDLSHVKWDLLGISKPHWAQAGAVLKPVQQKRRRNDKSANRVGNVRSVQEQSSPSVAAYKAIAPVTVSIVSEKIRESKHKKGRDIANAITWLVNLKTNLECVKNDPQMIQSQEVQEKITSLENALTYYDFGYVKWNLLKIEKPDWAKTAKEQQNPPVNNSSAPAGIQPEGSFKLDDGSFLTYKKIYEVCEAGLLKLHNSGQSIIVGGVTSEAVIAVLNDIYCNLAQGHDGVGALCMGISREISKAFKTHSKIDGLSDEANKTLGLS